MAGRVRAAGGVLWRPGATGVEVCLVHRSRHDDWSLPKGKLHAAEHPLAGAVREVREETGMRGRPQLRLPTVAYDLPGGTPKTVDYWLMEAVAGVGTPDGDEVDAVAWLPPRQAAARASYAADAALVECAADLPPVTAVLPLVRHGHAGKRGTFPGNDTDRPLDERGWAEAATLVTLLELFDPQRLRSSTPLRCRQTLQPLAERLNRPVETDPALDEPETPAEAPQRAEQAAERLVTLLDGPRTVVCSQGKVIPPMLAVLDGGADAGAYRTPKGGGWLLSFSGDRLAALDRL